VHAQNFLKISGKKTDSLCILSPKPEQGSEMTDDTKTGRFVVSDNTTLTDGTNTKTFRQEQIVIIHNIT
jgi:hypothetical protein